jgi:hypothetical protein
LVTNFYYNVIYNVYICSWKTKIDKILTHLVMLYVKNRFVFITRGVQLDNGVASSWCQLTIIFVFENAMWHYYKCTLFSIQLKCYDLQCRPLMLYVVGWKECLPSILSTMLKCYFSCILCGALYYHKQCHDPTIICVHCNEVNFDGWKSGVVRP